MSGADSARGKPVGHHVNKFSHLASTRRNARRPSYEELITAQQASYYWELLRVPEAPLDKAFGLASIAYADSAISWEPFSLGLACPAPIPHSVWVLLVAALSMDYATTAHNLYAYYP